MNQKPFSESCVQNSDVILAIIKPLLLHSKTLLEIGSGTGQHAVYFADSLATLQWQCSDCEANLDGIKSWLNEAGKENLLQPLNLDVTSNGWPKLYYDAVFTANSVHIMDDNAVQAMFCGVGHVLSAGGQFFVYGPFNYNGDYSSESNARFDQWLKQSNPQSGIKHIEQIRQLAGQNGMQLKNDFNMPANNQILHFVKVLR